MRHRWRRVFALLLPYGVLAAVVAAVVWSNHPGSAKLPTAPGAARAGERDVLCGMEVNAAWGPGVVYEGETYYFCSDYCKAEFEKAPGRHAGEKCLVCRARVAPDGGQPATYLGVTYRLCSEAHRRDFQADPAAHFMHRMWGIPPWLYYASIAAILLASFLVFEAGSATRPAIEERGPRADLLRLAPVRALLLSRPARAAAQGFFVAAF
ncbi:MAG: YHS domain-containing protein, partial [Candidatus Wallbacteria bacterium]|nr:YHS domain-containing protein [Candidatus Wallbacteria bacterium]